MAKVVKVILSDDLRGEGTKENVFRRVVQLWSLRGKLLIEYDPTNPIDYYVSSKLEAILDRDSMDGTF